jgi:hypothetical protein
MAALFCVWGLLGHSYFFPLPVYRVKYFTNGFLEEDHTELERPSAYPTRNRVARVRVKGIIDEDNPIE